MSRKLPGVLLRAPRSPSGDRVFYVAGGRRHWVRDAAWLAANGFVWPDDVVDVSEDILYAFRNAGPAPLCTRGDENQGGLTSMDLREIAGSDLRGVGVEFGAGAVPFPVPLSCRVLFADAYAYDALQHGRYPGQTAHDLIEPEFQTDFQRLHCFADASLDFIAACHVIEHTANPLAAISSCHRVLKPRGRLVLVVPDRNKTFDRARAVTPLAHVIEDWERPSRGRDRGHYVDFYRNAFTHAVSGEFEAFVSRQQELDYAIHFHAWDFDAFGELVDWCCGRWDWALSWSHRAGDGDEDIEFYFVLEKQGDDAGR